MRRALVFVAMLVGGLGLAMFAPAGVQDAEAQEVALVQFSAAGVPTILGVGRLLHIPDGGGQYLVPPAACDGGTVGCMPRQIRCGVKDVTSVVIFNPSTNSDGTTNTLGVRLGPSNVRAYPAAAVNGYLLAAGSSVAWDVADGVIYAVSTGLADAGVKLYVVCESGGF